MNFNKNKYVIIKKAISEDLAKFCNDYFMMKRNVARTMFDAKYISPFTDKSFVIVKSSIKPLLAVKSLTDKLLTYRLSISALVAER